MSFLVLRFAPGAEVSSPIMFLGQAFVVQAPVSVASVANSRWGTWCFAVDASSCPSPARSPEVLGYLGSGAAPSSPSTAAAGCAEVGGRRD